MAGTSTSTTAISRPRDESGIDPRRLTSPDPVRRQLLGWGTSAIGYWIPTEEEVPLRAGSPTR
ncbi:MAG TPA: hypothetical protein VE596_09950 [Gaiellaceae bacterium]|nr:hypothetical protein [Gaiellaceae bacterium]